MVLWTACKLPFFFTGTVFRKRVAFLNRKRVMKSVCKDMICVKEIKETFT